MNTSKNLMSNQPHLSSSPETLLAEGRKRVRRRRIFAATASPVSLLGVAALAISLQTGGWSTRPAPVMTPARTSTGASTLRAETLQAALEQGLGKHLQSARLFHDRTGKIDLSLSGTFDGKVVSLAMGRMDGTRGMPKEKQPTCAGDQGFMAGVPCTHERLADGSVLVVAQYDGIGNQIDNLAKLVRPDGTYLSPVCQNIAPGPQNWPGGEPPLSLLKLHRAALELNALYKP